MRLNSMRVTGTAAAAVALGILFVTPAGSASSLNETGTDMTCSSASPCLTESNTGTGPGIKGTSLVAAGVLGITTKNSTSAADAAAGLRGSDLSTSGTFDWGVRGISTRGTGVAGQSTSGIGISALSTTGDGVSGTSTNGSGVSGKSTNANGVSGISSNSIGVDGFSPSGYGVIGATESTIASVAAVEGITNGVATAIRAQGLGGRLFVGNNSNGFDVFTVDNGGNATIGANATIGGNTTIGGNGSVTGTSGADALIAGTSASAAGVIASGNEGVVGFGYGASPFGVVALNQASSGGQALVIEDRSGTGTLIDGYDHSGTLKLQVDDFGDVYAHNFFSTLDAQRQPTSEGRQLTTYAHQSSTPTLEDFGETQLTGGQAYVPLERAFASAIDQRAAYLVFITPEGDTRGLYVTQKTTGGFSVRENQGGHSTVAFSYRIVAKPYASTAARLAPAPEMRRVSAPPIVLRQMPRGPALHYVPKSKIHIQ